MVIVVIIVIIESSRKMDSCRCRRDLDVGVGVAPQEGEAGQPVLRVDRLPDASKLFRGQDANCGGKFGTGDFPANGAGSDLDLWVIADALDLSQFAACHEVELVIIFSEPDGGVDSGDAFPEGREADVTLAVDFCWNGSHADILKRCEEVLRGTRMEYSTSRCPL